MVKARFKSWKNTSDFPDAWAIPVCEWIAYRFLLDVHKVKIKIRRGNERSGCGRACWYDNSVTMTIRRRSPRSDWKYSTIRWGKQYYTNDALDGFVFLAAHELHHLSKEGRAIRDDRQRRLSHWRQSFEEATQRAAWETLCAWREERRAFTKLYAKRLRRERDKRRTLAERKRAAKSPAAKLLKMEATLADWEKRLEQAQRFVKKYRTKINRSRAALARFNNRTTPATPQDRPSEISVAACEG